MTKRSTKWSDGTITTGRETKGFTFPRDNSVFVKPAPAIVRKKSNNGRRKGRAVVAYGIREKVGRAKHIQVSSDTLTKLGCTSGDSVQYKKATPWNVLWTKRLTLAIAGLGFMLAVAQGIVSLVSVIPVSDRATERAIVWSCTAAIFITAFGVAGFTVHQASSDS